jgi:hypothetical protein
MLIIAFSEKQFKIIDKTNSSYIIVEVSAVSCKIIKTRATVKQLLALMLAVNEHTYIVLNKKAAAQVRVYIAELQQFRLIGCVQHSSACTQRSGACVLIKYANSSIVVK